MKRKIAKVLAYTAMLGLTGWLIAMAIWPERANPFHPQIPPPQDQVEKVLNDTLQIKQGQMPDTPSSGWTSPTMTFSKPVPCGIDTVVKAKRRDSL